MPVPSGTPAQLAIPISCPPANSSVRPTFTVCGSFGLATDEHVYLCLVLVDGMENRVVLGRFEDPPADWSYEVTTSFRGTADLHAYSVVATAPPDCSTIHTGSGVNHGSVANITVDTSANPPPCACPTVEKTGA